MGSGKWEVELPPGRRKELEGGAPATPGGRVFMGKDKELGGNSLGFRAFHAHPRRRRSSALQFCFDGKEGVPPNWQIAR